MGWGRFKFFVSSSSFSKFCVRILFKFPFGCSLIFKLWLQNCILHFLHFLFIILCFSPLGLARFKFFFLRIHLQSVAFKLLFEKPFGGILIFKFWLQNCILHFSILLVSLIYIFHYDVARFKSFSFFNFAFQSFAFKILFQIPSGGIFIFHFRFRNFSFSNSFRSFCYFEFSITG